jgi:putative nucleotidyltransferase with HDIG domain/PAS domain S-box-containing protein
MAGDLRVLIVEDSEDDADLLLLELKRGGYHPEYVRVSSRNEMVAALNQHAWDLILSDFAMPGFSGQGALELWKEKLPDVPFIVISGTIGEETAVSMMKAGASDYIMKQNLARLNAAIERELRDASTRRERKAAELRFSLFMKNFPGFVFVQDIDGKLVYANRQFTEIFGETGWEQQPISEVLPPEFSALLGGLLPLFEHETFRIVGRIPTQVGDRWYELTRFLISWADRLPEIGGFALDVTERVLADEKLNAANRDLKAAYDQTLQGWAQALELHERETFGHSKGVVDLAVKLSREMGLKEEDLEHVRRGALLHDIGKMGVSDAILQKPGPLSAEEWVIVKRHPALAYNWLSPIAYLRPAIDIPYCHHERWDGSGYPRQLAGEQIPLIARIFAVIDVFRALREQRSYGRVWSREESLEYIRSQSGIHFDPHVVDVFLRMMEKEA